PPAPRCGLFFFCPRGERKRRPPRGLRPRPPAVAFSFACRAASSNVWPAAARRAWSFSWVVARRAQTMPAPRTPDFLRAVSKKQKKEKPIFLSPAAEHRLQLVCDAQVRGGGVQKPPLVSIDLPIDQRHLDQRLQEGL